jgi:hypothetical protein
MFGRRALQFSQALLSFPAQPDPRDISKCSQGMHRARLTRQILFEPAITLSLLDGTHHNFTSGRSARADGLGTTLFRHEQLSKQRNLTWDLRDGLVEGWAL